MHSDYDKPTLGLLLHFLVSNFNNCDGSLFFTSLNNIMKLKVHIISMIKPHNYIYIYLCRDCDFLIYNKY